MLPGGQYCSQFAPRRGANCVPWRSQGVSVSMSAAGSPFYHECRAVSPQQTVVGPRWGVNELDRESTQGTRHGEFCSKVRRGRLGGGPSAFEVRGPCWRESSPGGSS